MQLATGSLFGLAYGDALAVSESAEELVRIGAEWD
jgi:hypothetical protein